MPNHDCTPYALAREKRLAALHRSLAAELGRAQFDGEAELITRLEAALWALGAGVTSAAHLTALERLLVS